MRLLLFITLLSVGSARASEVPVRVLKIFSNKREFVVQRNEFITEGTELYIRTANIVHPKKATVSTCKTKSCLAELEVGIFEMKQEDISTYQVTMDSQGKRSFYAGFGSPLGVAARVGLRKEFSEQFSLGAIAGFVNNKSGSATVKANTLSFQGIYELFRISDWRFNANGELGYAMSELHFSNEFDSSDIKENTYIAALSLETLYLFEKFKFGFNFGFSKNGYKENYPSDDGGEFSNPYGKLLAFMEFGLHYTF